MFYACKIFRCEGIYFKKSNIWVLSFIFFLQGPEFDEEDESELTVTELREKARKQKEELERRMMGDGSDEEKEEKEEDENRDDGRVSNEDSGCSWGMGECVTAVAGWSWSVSFGLIHDFSVLGLSLTFHITSAQILPAVEEAAPEEDENEENPFSTEFHEDQEAAYLKDPKKALQGFYDREGEKKYCRALKDWN